MQKTALCNWPRITLRYLVFTRIGSGEISGSRFLAQMLLVMRLTIFFLVVGILHVHAKGTSQSITLSGKNISLEKVFAAVKQQTGYMVFCNKEDLRHAKAVSLTVYDVPLVDFLDLALKGQNLIYEINSKIIVITEKDNKVVADGFTELAFIPITGLIVDPGGAPVANATLSIKGSSKKTTADGKGAFSIDASTGDILIISAVGFVAKEIKVVAGRTTLLVQLEIKRSNLDEVSVVAYGTTTRREATGSISTIKGKDFEGTPSSSLANLLQGRVAGMDVTNMSGSPGGGGTAITIRGFNSLGVEQQRRFSDPLWVVDGVPLNSFTSPVTGTNMLADINPDMIESVQVLKDASAASLYGSRAANGVIVVTTKKGSQNQKAQFSTNVSQSYNILPALPTITIGKAERDYRLNAIKNNLRAYYDPETMRFIYPSSLLDYYLNPSSRYDYFFTDQPSARNGNSLQDSLNSFYNNSTNFFPVYTEIGKTTNANIQTYGGSQNLSYGIGLGYYNESGVYTETGFNRIDLNSTLNVTPTPKLKIDLRFNASLIKRKRGERNDFLGSAPIIESVPGDPYKLSSLLPGEGSVVWNNVLEKLKGTKENNGSARLRSIFKIGYDILPGLNFSSSLAVDYAVHRRNYFQPSSLHVSGYSNSVGETAVNMLGLNENLLSYTRTIANKHQIKAIGGASYQYDREEYNGGNGANSPSDKIYYVRGGFPTMGEQSFGSYTRNFPFQSYQSNMVEKSLLSYFGRIDYQYEKKYFASASFRRDGSSVFGQDNKWGMFPSVAAGWSFSEESFIKDNLLWLDLGKIRASWGRSGMQFSQNYLALGIMQAGAPYQGNGVLVPEFTRGLYNGLLSWEQTDQYDIGVDLDLFDKRLSATMDYYYRYTDKMLIPVPLAGTYNGYEQQWRNAAAVSNEGIELLVSYEIFRQPNLFWKVSFNGARNWNRFEKSYDGRDIAQNWVIGKSLAGIYALRTNGYFQDQSQVPIFFNAVGMSNYLSAQSGKLTPYKAGDYSFIDINGDGEIGPDEDAIYIASALPIISGGLLQEFKWRNFDINMLITYQLGRHIINTMPIGSISTSNDDASKPLLLDLGHTSFWQTKNDNIANYPLIQSDNGNWIYATRIDRYIERVSWMKLKAMTIGYNLPAPIIKRFGMSGVRIFTSAENLFTISNYSGLDPETVPIDTGIDEGMGYPLARKFTLGLTLKF